MDEGEGVLIEFLMDNHKKVFWKYRIHFLERTMHNMVGEVSNGLLCCLQMTFLTSFWKHRIKVPKVLLRPLPWLSGTGRCFCEIYFVSLTKKGIWAFSNPKTFNIDFCSLLSWLETLAYFFTNTKVHVGLTFFKKYVKKEGYQMHKKYIQLKTNCGQNVFRHLLSWFTCGVCLW